VRFLAKINLCIEEGGVSFSSRTPDSRKYEAVVEVNECHIQIPRRYISCTLILDKNISMNSCNSFQQFELKQGSGIFKKI
jgi:hypothetical protein